MWHTLPSSSSTAPSPRYGLPPELGMFVVAPATSFHHPHAAHPDPSLISAADPAHSHNVGVIPLLAASIDDAGDFSGNRGGRPGAIHLWQDQPHQQGSYIKKGGSINFDNNSAAAANLLNPGGGSLPSSGGGTMTCQDCGNQAKKDCSHRRCRTCCKSRGFDCSTHVKSTWVPAARRRERQVMAAATGTGGGASSGSTSGAKKPRLISSQNTATTSHTSTSNTPPRSFETSSSHQDAGFKESLPGQVRAPAVFKCVKVTAMDDGDDEYAYQAVVKIGGHVFKGFLYDQGVESREGIPNISELHLGGGGSGGGGGRNGAAVSSPVMDPADVYGGSGGGLLGGSSYGNSIN